MANGNFGKKVSIVVPCYNEAAMVDAFCARLDAVTEPLDRFEFEFVFVDDGSEDATAELIERHAARDARVKLVGLSRNFGQQRAITAGLDFCTGDYVVVIDADFQDPPELIPEILGRLDEGYDVVHTVRVDRTSDSFAKRFSAKLAYNLMRRWVLPRLPENAGDYKGFNRTVLTALMQYRERVRFLRGMIATLGFRQISVPFTRPVRFAGETKFGPFQIARFARDGIVSYTVFPLRLGLFAGLVSCAAVPCYAAGAVAWHLAWGISNPLLAAAAGLILAFGGLNLVLIGLVGEYLGCLVREVKQRPLYLVRRTVNIPDGPCSRKSAAGLSV